MEALWRRLVFNILISNTDDHLRNHGFLYAGQEGWRLSPAYDLNPVPTDIKPRILTTAINEDDNTASLALALEVGGVFRTGRRQSAQDSGGGRQGRLEMARRSRPARSEQRPRSTAWRRRLSTKI